MATNTQISIPGTADAIPAYVVQPEGAPRGAIIVVQEIFGVNPGIRQKAEDWAARGYLAVAPDIFWRQEPGVEFDPDVAEEFKAAIGFMMKHDFVQGLEDLKAVLAWIRAEVPGIRTGLVGFCMGGRIAYEMATATDIEASVGYYGVMIDQMLDRASDIHGQLMLHVPTADGFVPAEAQAAMHAVLDRNERVTLHDYVGLDHGFADTFGARRNDDGAKLADARTESFFAEKLG